MTLSGVCLMVMKEQKVYQRGCSYATLLMFLNSMDAETTRSQSTQRVCKLEDFSKHSPVTCRLDPSPTCGAADSALR